MTVLVDTSIWIRRFASKEPFTAEIARLMERRHAVAHELVYGELLMGDTGGRESFLADYEELPFVRAVPHHEVVTLVLARRLHGRGIGWIDAHLLASTMAAHVKLWTADPRLAAIAAELGIAYIPPAA
jgi:predicted nucleic acid-binding protein